MYKMHGKTFSSLVLLAALSLTAVMVTAGGAKNTNCDNICENIVAIFNALNEAMPLRATFPAGQTPGGASYPTGTVTFVKAVKDQHDCISYPTTTGTRVRIFVSSSIMIQMPNFLEIENEVNITASEALVELRYDIANPTGNDDQVNLAPTFTEVRELGEVTLETEDGQGQDFTDEAEDVLRPLLFEMVNGFAKESLHFKIEPKSYEPSGAAYDAFKTIFKAYMYNIHTDVKQ